MRSKGRQRACFYMRLSHMSKNSIQFNSIQFNNSIIPNSKKAKRREGRTERETARVFFHEAEPHVSENSIYFSNSNSKPPDAAHIAHRTWRRRFRFKTQIPLLSRLSLSRESREREKKKREEKVSRSKRRPLKRGGYRYVVSILKIYKAGEKKTRSPITHHI